ncbi:MAG: hypothetical protein K2P57_04575 [Burkholderiales bacterium]|nr:hypothetical protein [Burkholderiales bacterium]
MGPDDDIFEALYQYTKGLSVALGYHVPRLHSEPVQFDVEEWAVMKRYSEIGEDIICPRDSREPITPPSS